MAVLSKIRERSMFLIVIIGLALFAFVLDPSTLGDLFNSNKVNEIGMINGASISIQEFSAALEASRQKEGNSVSEMQAIKTVWDKIIRKKIYQNQLAEAGATLSEVAIWNEVIKSPSIKTNPQFLNEIDLFDEVKLKQFLIDTKENNIQLWEAWSDFMNEIGDNLEKNTYNNLVTAGLGASLKEGEFQYFEENTKLKTQFVFIPYASISDSLVAVSKAEITTYIKENAEDFKIDESRDIVYVKFPIVATTADKNAIKEELSGLVKDFKSTSDEKEFLSENDSDTTIDENFKFEKELNETVASVIFKGAKGNVFGPYKDQESFKITKITAVSKLPDSTKASHILISFVGAEKATSEITRTEDEAEKLADSILNLVKKDTGKFVKLAKDFSSDKSSKTKGGDLDWFAYDTMTPKFRDFAFEGEKGAIEVVKTPFGYHIIKIDAQKNKQKVLKLATFTRTIIASEETENEVFQRAGQFVLEVSKDKKFFEVAKKNKYVPKPVIGLKVLEEDIPGLGSQRQIVSWAFGKKTKLEDFKTFDLEGSLVSAFITAKTEKGLMTATKATNKVRPILINEKKAKLIATKFNASSLTDIAKENNTTVRNGNDLTLKNPTLSGAGSEPKIVGAMFNAALHKVYKNIAGNRGVYAFMVINKENPRPLPSYETTRNTISESRKRKTTAIYEAIKKASDIEDNRANLYVKN